jgi:hypothetical protein
MRRRLIVLFIFLLLAAGFAYAFVYLDKTPLKLSPSLPAPSIVATPSTSATPLATSSPGAEYLPGQAFAQVQTFYSSYEQNASILTKYVAPALATQITQSGGAQDVFCAPDPPSSISYDPPTADTGDTVSAIVPIHESFVSGSMLTINVTVSLTNLLITNIACPAPQN